MSTPIYAPNPFDGLNQTLMQLLLHKQTMSQQQEELKLRQQQLKLQQDEAAARQQQQAEQSAQAWNALAQAMQTLGPQAAMQAAPNLAPTLTNANYTAPQVQTEVNAAMGKGGTLAGAVQEDALGKISGAKSVGEILTFAKRGGLGEYETDTAINTFVKAQAAQEAQKQQDALLATLSPAQRRSVQVLTALKTAGLDGTNLENEALRLGVKPTEFQAAQLASEKANAAQSRAATAAAYRNIKKLDDEDAAGRQAAAYLGLPVWAAKPALEMMATAARPTTAAGQQAVASRALFGMLGRTDAFGNTVFTPEEAITRTEAGMNAIYPGFKLNLDEATQAQIGFAATLPAAIQERKARGMKDAAISADLIARAKGIKPDAAARLVREALTRAAMQP